MKVKPHPLPPDECAAPGGEEPAVVQAAAEEPASGAVVRPEESAGEGPATAGPPDAREDAPAGSARKKQALQLFKFLCFSLSAGVIQLASFTLLYNVIAWKNWWATYLISVVLSVLWNFTFNRKFTFASAGNVPLAMALVTVYYCAFIPVSMFGGNALEAAGWNGTLVTLLMMVANFATEFVWDKFVVFNDPLLKKIFRSRNKKK